ncbi:hypothetical protein D9613_010403 [Agrocybe pediades]|uniref:Uncharacterized protein n=1 Tax=Agrocybe pediades TaxID=84607 RepID=A0A8H4VI21_9AGAR|nr:hypothetical protein D9613_010403 [Agrocybe pediades]
MSFHIDTYSSARLTCLLDSIKQQYALPSSKPRRDSGRDVPQDRAGRTASVLRGPPQPPPYNARDRGPQNPGSFNEQTPLRQTPNSQRYGSNGHPSIPVRLSPIETQITDPERNSVTIVKMQTEISRFHIFSYLFIGLVFGYIFATLVCSASWKSEEINHERMRRLWSREADAHESLRSRMLEESTAWKNEKIARDAAWYREANAHERLRSHMLEESTAWKNEKIARDAERAQWERKQKEGREGIAWEGFVRSDRCLRYGTREYTATLTHVPLGFDAMAECMKKPAFINGRELLPTRCEDPGCDGNTDGKRRFEGQLINLHPGDDWHVLCPTTPVVIRGRHLSAPDTCADWEFGESGLYPTINAVEDKLRISPGLKWGK